MILFSHFSATASFKTRKCFIIKHVFPDVEQKVWISSACCNNRFYFRLFTENEFKKTHRLFMCKMLTDFWVFGLQTVLLNKRFSSTMVRIYCICEYLHASMQNTVCAQCSVLLFLTFCFSTSSWLFVMHLYAPVKHF